MIKMILGASLFLFSIGALAGDSATYYKSSFAYYDNQSFYSCDSVESLTNKVLKIIGATDVRVYCNGGLPYQVDISADITYTLPTQQMRPVTLKGSESCQFSVDLIDAILKPLNLANLKKSDSCWHSEGQYQYSFNLQSL